MLPAVPKRLEGLDPTLAILDEFEVISRDVYEVIALAAGKREVSLTLGIGTPPADWSDSVLADMRTYAAEHPEDETFVWREYSAAGFEDHPVDCRHCSQLANPALGDFLPERIIASFLPPKTREATFRRARLCQFAEELADAWLPPRAWDDCADQRPIPDGAEVVLALDGSFSQDATALVACQIGDLPHIDVPSCGNRRSAGETGGCRSSPSRTPSAPRAGAGKSWQIVDDPFRWARSLQILAADGLPVLEFPQSAQRMTPATTGLYEAVVNGTVTHSGDPRLARHVGDATVRTDSRGTRIYKEHKHSTRRIDLAVCAIMAHSVAATIDPGLQPYWYDEAS